MGYSLTVPRFGMVVEVNLSRTFLLKAHDALEAGRLVEAGVYLREAVRRQLVAECRWHDVLPKNFSDRTPPIVLLRALRSAGKCGRHGYEMTCEIIDVGNRAAHCQAVDRYELTGSIAIWHTAIDADPCGEPSERIEHCKPVVENDADNRDDDEGDGANWWKSAV